MDAAVAVIVAAWVGSVFWTARDAGRRCEHALSRFGWPLAAILLPFVGAGVYALVRPYELRTDVRARRMRTRMFESVLARRDEQTCAACATPLRPDFRCCPSCGERVRAECDCGRLVGIDWAMCPWCTRPVVQRERAVA